MCVGGGGSSARSKRITDPTDLKISFSLVTKIGKKDALFINCYYTRNSVSRKQNREWLRQGPILQIAPT